MKPGFYAFLITLISITLNSSLFAQSPNLVGGNSTLFDNTDPCVLTVEFNYTNNGTADAGAFKNGLYLTTDLFTADPAWDILVAESSNGQGCQVGQSRTVYFTNQPIDNLPGFQSGVTYYVYVYLDSGEDIMESDEGDNLYSVGNTNCTVVGILDPFSQAIDVRIGPNPGNDHTIISVEHTTLDPVEVQVFDLQGRLLRTLANSSSSGASSEFRVDLEGWAAGTYWVKVLVDDKIVTRKFMVR